MSRKTRPWPADVAKVGLLGKGYAGLRQALDIGGMGRVGSQVGWRHRPKKLAFPHRAPANRARRDLTHHVSGLDSHHDLGGLARNAAGQTDSNRKQTTQCLIQLNPHRRISSTAGSNREPTRPGYESTRQRLRYRQPQ